MKILQVNRYESPGCRFHGLAITPLLKKYGVESRHLVWQKDTQNPDVLTFKKKDAHIRNKMTELIERAGSLQSVLYQNVDEMIEMPAFKKADLVHLHIIHSYLNISDIPKITKLKPTVLTLHDPWILTGHCIHPFDCKRWMIGCGDCPDIKSELPLLQDTTRFLFNDKHKAYKASDFDVIVTSKWMHDMVQASPMLKNKQIHHLPFGLDINFFSPDITSNAKQSFGIEEDAVVICFRGDNSPFKGLQYIIQALKKIKTDQKICLLLLGHSSSIVEENFLGRFRVINLGWVNDEKRTRDALVASDIFLMPSVAETFGMMAIEAMACGKPIIVFEGTSLPDVTFAPDVGISVPMRDAQRLYLALQRLIDNPDERKKRGSMGRIIAERHYDEKKHVEHLTEIYKKIVKNR